MHAYLLTEADRIGMPVPTTTLHVRVLLGAGQRPLLHVWSPKATVTELVAWSEPLGPVVLDLPRNRNRVTRLELAVVPTRWAGTVARIEVAMMTLDPTGAAEVEAEGDQEGIRSFIEKVLPTMGGGGGLRSLRPADHSTGLHMAPFPSGSRVPLTPRQQQVVLLAHQRGYYAMPREVSLEDLARELGVSGASVSETLRRAEAQLIVRFVEDARDLAATPTNDPDDEATTEPGRGKGGPSPGEDAARPSGDAAEDATRDALPSTTRRRQRGSTRDR